MSIGVFWILNGLLLVLESFGLSGLSGLLGLSYSDVASAGLPMVVGVRVGQQFHACIGLGRKVCMFVFRAVGFGLLWSAGFARAGGRE